MSVRTLVIALLAVLIVSQLNCDTAPKFSLVGKHLSYLTENAEIRRVADSPDGNGGRIIVYNVHDTGLEALRAMQIAAASFHDPALMGRLLETAKQDHPIHKLFTVSIDARGDIYETKEMKFTKQE